MEVVVWIGAVLSLIGLCGIVYSIVAVAKAKRAVSMIGLMAVIIGVMLG